MKIKKILMPQDVIKGLEIPVNSIILYLDNKTILVCSKFNHSRKQNLELLVWLPTKKQWYRAYAKNEHTEMMWNFYRKHQQKRKKKHVNYEEMMKHDRIHKSGGGGSRIYNGSITDYECTKKPLHDFRYSRYVQYNNN